jgi:hypothetical protein
LFGPFDDAKVLTECFLAYTKLLTALPDASDFHQQLDEPSRLACLVVSFNARLFGSLKDVYRGDHHVVRLALASALLQKDHDGYASVITSATTEAVRLATKHASVRDATNSANSANSTVAKHEAELKNQ